MHHFNPRSPRGERRPVRICLREGSASRGSPISTHAPREGSDSARWPPTLPARGATRSFQPTLPARGATSSTAKRRNSCGHSISTHAPREGSDGRRPPLPARGAITEISTRAPREGSDSGRRISRLPARGATRNKFQPALPARGATANISKFSKAELSNIAKLCIELQQKLLCFPFKSVFSPLNLPPSPHFSVRTSRRTSARLSFAPHNIKGSSGMYVCLQPKCSILFSYRLPR